MLASILLVAVLLKGAEETNFPHLEEFSRVCRSFYDMEPAPFKIFQDFSEDEFKSWFKTRQSVREEISAEVTEKVLEKVSLLSWKGVHKLVSGNQDKLLKECDAFDLLLDIPKKLSLVDSQHFSTFFTGTGVSSEVNNIRECVKDKISTWSFGWHFWSSKKTAEAAFRGHGSRRQSKWWLAPFQSRRTMAVAFSLPMVVMA
eukprot:GEMP01057786.1.p1 GENE.GEMP01057786.1~~GEMP01057786.1.p1  ORF type:complete len:229 (+),score=29.94 GEMP01057786.1:86-688(+)